MFKQPRLKHHHGKKWKGWGFRSLANRASSLGKNMALRSKRYNDRGGRLSF
jgi:hypothetical protein